MSTQKLKSLAEAYESHPGQSCHNDIVSGERGQLFGQIRLGFNIDVGWGELPNSARIYWSQGGAPLSYKLVYKAH